MPKNKWYYRFQDAGMIQRGHVVLSSGWHTNTYVNCALPLIRLDPVVDEIVEALAKCVRIQAAQHSGKIAFAGVGKGVHYAERIARWCQAHHTKNEFLFAFAQRRLTGRLFLPYNQRLLLQDAEVVVVDDVHMTGRTFHDLAKLMNGHTAGVLQYLTIVNRSQRKSIDDGKASFVIESLLQLPYLRKWRSRHTCSLCKSGVPYSTSIEGGLDEFTAHGQPAKNA